MHDDWREECCSGSVHKASACNAETIVQSLGQEDTLEKEMATHSSTPAWRIPWTEKPHGLQSMGSQKVGHDWVTNTHTLSIASFTLKTLRDPTSAVQKLLLIGVLKIKITCKERPYQMLFYSINHFNASTLFCLSFFCFSCADPVFPVFPALEWKHFHICVPCLQQPLLLHSHPGSSHCWLMVGKIQVRMMGGHISKKLHRLNMQRLSFQASCFQARIYLCHPW